MPANTVEFKSFCGPSYELTNKWASVEKTVNWYLEANESRGEAPNWDFEMLPSPGNGYFSGPLAPPFNQRSRGLMEYRDGVYGVNGSVVFFMDSGGGLSQIGDFIPDDGHPVSMAANANNQIGIASAGELWVIDVVSRTLIPVPTTPTGFLGASFISFQDGYLLALIPGTNSFQWSGTDTVPVGDMTQWDAANIQVLAGQTDLLTCLISSREYLRLLGTRRSQIFYDSGAINAPFVSYNATFIEHGIVAPYSMTDLGDSLMWLGQDQRGLTTAYRDHAFQPRVVSTFAVQQQWQTYPRWDDAVAFSYIWDGHLIWRITFITADKTWEYDATMSDLLGRSIWTERNFTDYQGVQHARPEVTHCFAYGYHLCGSMGLDGDPGRIYRMSDEAYTDMARDGDGNQIQVQIVRDRITPHIRKGRQRIIYNRIEFELARGVGLDGAPPVGVDPVLQLCWSNDGGSTYGSWHQIEIGRLGNYLQRVYFNRCGYARSRVFWIRCSDPVYYSIVNAYLDFAVCGS